MPEGPQVRYIGNMIEQFVGAEITSVTHPPSRVPWELALPTSLARVEVVGKNIFINLSDGQIIYNHLLMWGWWLPARTHPRKRVNTIFETNKGPLGYFGGGIIKLVSSLEAGQIKAKLGPDIMQSDSAEAAFAKVRSHALPIGEALLDQTLVAGIGNIYKSEGLFAARINPVIPAHNLATRQYDRLFTFLKAQMMADVTRRGKITTTTLEAQKAGHYNFVYRRLGQPCLFCGTLITRIYQGQKLPRSTYYCPKCQRNTLKM